MLVGCPDWINVAPAFGGWMRLVWTKGTLEDEKLGDGDGFTVTKPTSWAFELTSFAGVFPAGKVLVENKKTK
jgi:hypothetical protein